MENGLWKMLFLFTVYCIDLFCLLNFLFQLSRVVDLNC